MARSKERREDQEIGEVRVDPRKFHPTDPHRTLRLTLILLDNMVQ
jgi:hypothetical protein